MSVTPLKAGDRVKLLHEYPDRPAARPDHAIGYAGGVGFTLKGGGPTYYWHDRGVTWSSETLDRIDATKLKFTEAAKGWVGETR